MRTLYIIHVGKYLTMPNSGVYQKTIAQLCALSKLFNVEVVGFGFGANADKRINWIDCTGRDRWHVLKEWTREHLTSKDLVIMRYPWASRDLLEWVDNWGHQVFLEHNTCEASESKLIQKRAWKSRKKNIFSRSFIKFTWDTWVTEKNNEILFGPQILSKVLGGICVTHEIANYEKKRFKEYKTFVLPNCVNNFHLRENYLDWNGNHIKVIMIIGSLSIWHGMDRIVRSLKSKTTTGLFIQLDIVGLEEIDDFQSLRILSNVEVNFLGEMHGDELKNLCQNYHIAIGSLGLHRIGLKEASPLKVREYWSHGLPVILSYLDTAIIDFPEMSKWALNVSSDDNPFDWMAVKDYIDKLYLSSNWKENLIKDAEQSIHYDHYVQRLAAFISNSEI
jgi:glycosyltransferase involved in cell wall biosynthesis